MKSIVTTKERKEEFPRLMISSLGTIVLFVDNAVGMAIIVGKDSPHDIGDYSKGWDRGDFTPFNGTITLSND